MKRTISIALLAALLLFLFSLPVHAADLYLIDNASLLSSDEAARVSGKLQEVSEEIGIDVLVRTTDSLGYKSARAYADDAMDYEYGAVEDGILLLLSMEERDWYVSTRGSGISVFDDDGIDWMMDQVLPSLKGGDYEEAFLDFARAAKEYSETDHTSFISNHTSQRTGFHFSIMGLVVCFVIGLVVAIVVVMGMKGQLKTARFQNANHYLLQNTFHLTQNVDLFLYKNVTKVKIESESSGHSGGGGTHISSSGASHGGHGGKF